MLAGIGAMGLLGTPGCAALTEESPRDVAEEGGPRESSSPTPQKEPINAGEPFSGEIAPGMLCVAEYATNALAVVDARAGEVVGRIPVGRNPASVLVMQGIVFVGCSGTGEVTAVPVANPAAAAPIPVGHQISRAVSRRGPGAYLCWRLLCQRRPCNRCGAAIACEYDGSELLGVQRPYRPAALLHH